MASPRLPTYFISHGGGPWPWMKAQMNGAYDQLEASLKAVAPLRDQGVLIIGSGLSYHNLRAFGPGGQAASKAFDQWLQSAVVDSSPAERSRRLLDWASAPAARMAHPREDHLVPLMVAVGAAEGESARCVYHEDSFFGGITVSSFMFGEGHAPS